MCYTTWYYNWCLYGLCHTTGTTDVAGVCATLLGATIGVVWVYAILLDATKAVNGVYAMLLSATNNMARCQLVLQMV